MNCQWQAYIQNLICKVISHYQAIEQEEIHGSLIGMDNRHNAAPAFNISLILASESRRLWNTENTEKLKEENIKTNRK